MLFSSFTLSVNNKAATACEIFGERPQKPLTLDDIILNGSNAERGEFPYFASLGYLFEGEITLGCRGVLISNRFVLTVANCVNKRHFSPTNVLLGKVKIFFK
jgi:secreted trypsin-like serine protease